MYLCFPSERSYVHLLLLIIFFIQVISQLRILGRSVTAGSKFDREIWSNELSPVLNLWKKLNQVSSEIFFLCFPFFLPILFSSFIPKLSMLVNMLVNFCMDLPLMYTVSWKKMEERKVIDQPKKQCYRVICLILVMYYDVLYV